MSLFENTVRGGVTGVASSRGSTEIFVPPVIIGAWQLLERNNDEERAVDLLMEYAKQGFTTFDTADIYGASQQIIGKFRKRWAEYSREAGIINVPIRVFTKYVTHDASPVNANRVLEMRAVKELKLDDTVSPPQIDLVQFHWWNFKDRRYVDVAESLFDTYASSSDDRKGLAIAHLGLCNFDTRHAKRVIEKESNPSCPFKLLFCTGTQISSGLG